MYTIHRLTVDQPHYPPLLKEIHLPPQQLFYAGDRELLSTPSIGIVGSRAMTVYGSRACEKIVAGLVRVGLTIVSGLATGIDAVAHRTTLASSGRTIAVVANGLHPRVIFPVEHKALAEKIVAKNGTLVSEYTNDTIAKRYFFPARNRIIAGLCLGVVVIEAHRKSGALITAARALESNRDVFAVPGSIFSNRSAGVHQLLKQGATLVESAEDILEQLGLATVSDQPFNHCHQCTIDQKQIIQQLQTGPQRPENMIQQLACSPTIIIRSLTELEIKGIVRRNSDDSYQLV